MKRQSKNLKEEKDGYLLSDDIRFPTFNNLIFEKSLKELITKETIIKELDKMNSSLDEIINLLVDIIINNKNSFNPLCYDYNKNSFNYLAILELIKELVNIISSKIKGEQFGKLIEFKDLFEKSSKYKNIIKANYLKNDTNLSLIKQKISFIIKDIKEIHESSNECGIIFMCHIIKYFIFFLSRIKIQINKFLSIKKIDSDDNEVYHNNLIIFFDLIFMLEKLDSINMMLHNAYLIKKDDIFNLDENSNEWNLIKKIVFRVHVEKEKEIKSEFDKSFLQFQNMRIILTQAINKDSYSITNLARASLMLMKFKLSGDNTLNEFESKRDKILNEKGFLKQMIDLNKISIIKSLRGLTFPKISFRKKIYMKKEHPDITFPYIKQLLMKMYEPNLIEKHFGDFSKIKAYSRDITKLNSFPLCKEKVEKENKSYFVSTRLLYTSELNIIDKIVRDNPTGLGFINVFSSSFFNVFEGERKENPKELIIHIHGGGFFKSSTFFHESFLREWCNELKIPIIGIDYSGAPDHPYPEGLNDCYQAYMWILEHSEKELSIKPDKIIISGDSSGGNFVLALTFLLLCINEYEDKNIHIPDLLLPIYPCCHTGIKNISLSMVTALDQFLLDENSLKFINKSYRGFYPNEIDPFLNPIMITEKILKKFPRSRFITSTFDPLRDDTVRLLSKISKIPKLDVKCFDFNNYPHAFLGQENKLITEIPNKIIINEIREFLNN